jgi:hypothetical protein
MLGTKKRARGVCSKALPTAYHLTQHGRLTGVPLSLSCPLRGAANEVVAAHLARVARNRH